MFQIYSHAMLRKAGSRTLVLRRTTTELNNQTICQHSQHRKIKVEVQTLQPVLNSYLNDSILPNAHAAPPLEVQDVPELSWSRCTAHGTRLMINRAAPLFLKILVDPGLLPQERCTSHPKASKPYPPEALYYISQQMLTIEKATYPKLASLHWNLEHQRVPFSRTCVTDLCPFIYPKGKSRQFQPNTNASRVTQTMPIGKPEKKLRDNSNLYMLHLNSEMNKMNCQIT